MMGTAIGEPQLERPTVKLFQRVSPSRYMAMQACLLQEVWTASGNSPLLPPSPHAELGSIAHRILEAAGRGELEGVGNGKVAEKWDALVGEAEARMELSPLRRHQVPLSRSVSDFQVRKLRTCRRAAEIAHDAHRSSGGHPEHFHSATGFEIWVESDDGKVGGFIDCASATTGGVVLSDYKSGTVLESGNKECPGQIKKAYRIQMELYAALYWKKTGAWPVRLEVVPLQGEPLDVHLEPRHAEQLLDEAKAFLRFANDRIAAVQRGTADATGLAAAQPEHCRLCLFRPACKVYWITRQQNADRKWPIDLRGVLQELVRLRNGKLCLWIEDTETLPPLRTAVRNITDSLRRHPYLHSARIGSSVAIYGLRYDYRSGDYIETQNTTVYVAH